MLWSVSSHLKKIITQPVTCLGQDSCCSSGFLILTCQGQVLALIFPNEDWHLTFVSGSECLKLACETWLGPAPGGMICMPWQGSVVGIGTSPSSHILQRSMKNIRWKIAIESGTSHMLSLSSPVISFPLDSECRSKIKASYVHSWETITSLMTTTTLFLLDPSIRAHPLLLQQSLAGAWKVLTNGIITVLTGMGFCSSWLLPD